MSGNRSATAMSAEPNLTPILDMVFQLITFFMLSISFKEASVDTRIHLPMFGSASPSSEDHQQDVVVLNISDNGTLSVYGHPCDLDEYLTHEATTIRAKYASEQKDSGDQELLATAVIRADKATPFTKLNQVLQACKKHGFRKVTLKVLGPAGTAETTDQVEL
ncbi:MAG: biopolymer transporter ExbD [Pirellulales bacterium]